MGQKYKQLSLEERCTISYLYKERKSIQTIAATLGRSASTVSREIKRNIANTKVYSAEYAHLQTAGRRWNGAKLERQPELRSTVLDLLAMGWSPQQISERLAQERRCRVISHESIYRFIYSQKKRTTDRRWRNYLPRKKYKRGWRAKKGGSPVSFIKDRVPLHKRASYVLNRQQAGHWEADLMLFSKYGQTILIAHERHSRMNMIFKLKNKEAKTVISQLGNLFDCLPKQLQRSITFDNGTEFANHYHLNKRGIKTFFCDVRSPWQKGGVENSIGRLRRFLPRKVDLDDYKEKDLEDLIRIYNHTPRKCLGYKTPAEVFIKKLLHFKCESTCQLKARWHDTSVMAAVSILSLHCIKKVFVGFGRF